MMDDADGGSDRRDGLPEIGSAAAERAGHVGELGGDLVFGELADISGGCPILACSLSTSRSRTSSVCRPAP